MVWSMKRSKKTYSCHCFIHLGFVEELLIFSHQNNSGIDISSFLSTPRFFWRSASQIVAFTLQAAESEECASYKAAMDAGHPVRIEANQSLTLADGKECLWLVFVFLQGSYINGLMTSGLAIRLRYQQNRRIIDYSAAGMPRCCFRTRLNETRMGGGGGGAETWWERSEGLRGLPPGKIIRDQFWKFQEKFENVSWCIFCWVDCVIEKRNDEFLII